MRSDNPVFYSCDAPCQATWARGFDDGPVRDVLSMQADGWTVSPSTTAGNLGGVKHLCPEHADYWHVSWGKPKRKAGGGVVDETNMSTVTGTIRASFSENDQCRCCPGAHRFTTEVVLDHRVSAYDTHNNIRSWLNGQLHALPDGTRVRVEVSVVDSQAGGE